MRTIPVSLPELALLAATRGLLGAGIALLLADRIAPQPRRATGWVLTAIGVLSTIPLATRILDDARRERHLRQVGGGWDPDSVRRASHETALPEWPSKH